MSQIIYRNISTIKNTEKSQVCLAIMEGKEEPVVIKRMNTANLEVYKVLSEIQNEHLPQIYAWEWQENELVVAEEYVDGESLEYYLREDILTEEQKLKFALQLCEAVEVLHNCVPHIIHRDIKPSNVLITEDGILKLIDFDASRQYKKMSGESDTRILGTADYAAPEQFGFQQTDVRSDIYSIGVVLELLQYHGDGLAKLSWKRILEICTNFDPKRRYKSVNMLEKAIRRTMWLLRFQWYGLGAILCILLLSVMSGWWITKSMDAGKKQPNTQMDTGSQESEVSEIPEDIDEEKLAAIKQVLEGMQAYVSEYYQGNRNLDFLLYSDRFENDIEVCNVTLIDLVKEEQVNPENSFRFEHSIFIMDADYMQTLKPSYYSLNVEFLDKKTGTMNMHNIHIRVYSETEPFVENQYALATNYLDYQYEKYDTLHIIVCSNTKYRITGLHLVNGGSVGPNLYRILYDGRAAELSVELLEQCKNAKETLFEVEFDNGRRERLIIANPYLQ